MRVRLHTKLIQYGIRHQSTLLHCKLDWPYSPKNLQSGNIEFGLNRSLMIIHGKDTNHFINGLVTRNCDPWDGEFYCNFLNRIGRILTDAFIYPIDSHSMSEFITNDDNDAKGDGGYLIDCDSMQFNTLYTHLSLRKLHSKVSISKVSSNNLTVGSIWNENWIDNDQQSNDLSKLNPILVAPDTRMGNTLRYIHHHHHNQQDENALQHYTQRMFLYGIPSTKDIISTLPFDYNMDKLNAINFKKGCYLGQELTIRTFHGGIIRKRLIPGYIYNINNQQNDLTSLPSHVTPSMESFNVHSAKLIPTNTTTSGTNSRQFPKIISNFGNLVLVMTRNQYIENLNEPFLIDGDNNLGVKLLYPFWSMD